MTWHAHGELRPVRGQPPQVWLHVDARGALFMTCQRCLQPLRVEVEADRDFRFVEGEEAAAAEDAVSEDDVLAISAALNLEALIEDELVLTSRRDSIPEFVLHSAAVSALDRVIVEGFRLLHF